MAREHYLAASALSPPHPTRAAAAVSAADMALALGDAEAAAREYEAALGLAGLTESLRQAAGRHGALTLTLTPTLTLTLTLTLILTLTLTLALTSAQGCGPSSPRTLLAAGTSRACMARARRMA